MKDEMAGGGAEASGSGEYSAPDCSIRGNYLDFESNLKIRKVKSTVIKFSHSCIRRLFGILSRKMHAR